MEKHTPHYPLSEVKACLRTGKVRSTGTALAGAAALGFDFHDMQTVIEGLAMQDFYKSMTSYQENHIWHDVYRPQTAAGEVYLKLTIVESLLIVSFKEL
jgi:motility quorum-sensing regulator/GCU-specific mRNA interferase toxin